MPDIQTYTPVGAVQPTDKLLGIRDGQTVLVEGLEDPGNSNITGGSINGTPIGAITADTGKFTTLETTETIIEGRVTANISGIYNIDPSLGNNFDLTLIGDTVITASATAAPLTAIQKQEIITRIVMGGAGSFRLTWAGIVWNAGLAPTLGAAIGSGLTARIIYTTSEISGFAQPDANSNLNVASLTASGAVKSLAPIMVINNISTLPYPIQAIDSKTTYTNEGATAKAYFSLPPAAAGLEYTFIVEDSDGLRFVAQTGQTIRSNTSVSGSGGLAESTTVGSVMTIRAINATEWISVSTIGTWTIT